MKGSWEQKPASALLRLFLAGLLVLTGSVGAERCTAQDLWGGSVGLTSDYVVRGVSRSDDRAAAQIDLHFLNAAGFVAGLFASDARIYPDAPHDMEVSGFVGFAWSPGGDWRSRILASHYSYPQTEYGNQYHYDEVQLDLTYRGWAQLSLAYSPDSPDYLPSGQVSRVSAESAEFGMQRHLLGKLSGTVGVGYYYLSGAYPGGYAYGSAGLAYDLAPLSLALTYVNATAEAKSLFYNTAAGGRWIATAIWRF